MLLFLGLLAGVGARAALDPTQDKILYAVATAHLDDQWNWTIQDTINSWIPDTLHQNFAFFSDARYTNYVFSFEGAWRYQLAQEYYPSDFLTLSNYIQQGRWRLAGSALSPGDVNLPSPESLIRHTLYANHYWAETFGQAPVDLFLPDCFGFGYVVPTVAAHCGLKGFSSTRIGVGASIPMPFQNIGRWIGPDGGSIIAVVQPGAYGQDITENLANSSYYNSRIQNMYAASGLYLDYMYFGTGDVGGAPSASSVSNLCLSVQTTNGLINVLSAGSDQLYRDLTAAQVNQLPSYRGEILAQTLGTGSYTAHGELKKYHRQCELRADAAERAAVVADWLQGGGTYPQQRLNKAWGRFLWHEFHDDLTGTAIPAAYTFSWNDYLLSLGDFASEETRGVGVLAKALDTTAAGVPLVVYNPLSVAREDIVEASVTFSNGIPPAVRVFDGNGSEVPSQMGVPAGNLVPVVFLANVPANGAAVYEVRPSDTPCALGTGLSVSSSQLQSSRYRVQLNANGDVASILDQVNGRQLLSAPIRWDFLYDLSVTWPAWEIQYNNITAAPTSYLRGPVKVQVLENGPARVTLAVTRYNAGSTFTERLRLAAGGAGDRVEWDVCANWNTPQTLCKLEFPLAVANANATFDLGMGTIQRPNATPNLYEVPAQQWADLTSSDGSYGVTIMNDCKYGWDKPSDNTLRLSIFHTPAVGGIFTYQATNSFGTHRILIGLMGHTNDWRSGGSPWVAARLNQPLQAFQTLPHTGALGKTFSFLSLDNANVMVKAIKKAEDSSEVVVRLQELSGQPQQIQITCASPITAARLLTGSEAPLSAPPPADGKLSLSLGAYAPMTVALTLAAPASPIPTPASAVVPLPFNLDAISTDANRTDGNFDSGYSYPAEQMPSNIVRGGITFQLGRTNNGALNALSCQGQTIGLNAAGYDRLYLLAAAASHTTTGTFAVGGLATNLTVPYFTGFIGQWNPPWLYTNQEVAWVCTHRHDSAGNNEAYNFCYLYQYGIDLPPNASAVILPNAPNIRIFAMSLAAKTSAETVAAGAPLRQNLPPWANAGPNQLVTAATSNETAIVTLNGSGSIDPDGSVVSYAWSQNGTPLATGINPVVTLPVGTNQVLLTVTDNEGATGVGEVSITVLPPLTVSLSATPTNASNAPLVVQFTGQATGGMPAQAPFDTTDDHQGTVTAAGENNGINGNWEVATNAFDDTLAKWLDFANNNPTTRASWIQYQYPGGQQLVVTNYTITSANDSPERDPANWALLGSNDGGASWVTLDTQVNQVFTDRYQTRGYPIASPGAYNIYRLRIDSVANPATAVAVQLSEIQLLGTQKYTYWWSFGDGTSSTSEQTGAPDQPQHTYADKGSYTVVLGVTYGIYSGTNTIQINIGPPLAATATASPATSAAPVVVQFTGQATGGRSSVTPIDTTDDHRGTVTAAGENAGVNGYWEVATNAFDDTTGSKWLDFASSYPNTRQSWIQYQYANGQRFLVSRYTITSANDAAIYPERNPANWRLLGSNNGGASWVTLDIRTNQVFTANFQKLAYGFINTTAYNIYRFQIDSVANPAEAVGVQLDELEFLLVPAPYSYSWSFGDGTTSTNQSPQHTYAANGTYTATLVVSDGLTSATNTTVVSLAPPSLTISFTADGQLYVSWPAWATNYGLFRTASLALPVAWSPVTNTITTVGDQSVVVLPMDATNRFFRLGALATMVANVVVGQVRVQLLSDSLVRLESAGSAGFEDRPTFHVLDRGFAGVAFTSNNVAGEVVLTTTNYVVHIPLAATSLAGAHVDSPSGLLLYSGAGRLTNSAWLEGPGESPLVLAFADTPRIVAPAWGVAPAPLGAAYAETSGWDLSNDAPDVYVFVPHGDYYQLRRDFLKLTGPTELAPLFALGAFDSRWYDYSEATALQQIDDYRAHRIPLDVLVNDAGWRAQEYVYQPNTNLFPNLPRYFLEAHARHVRIQFNDHPQPVNAALSALDPSEVQYRYAGLSSILGQGLDIWWYDRNWSTAVATPAAGLRKEVWGMRTYHDMTLTAKPGLRPLIMANVDGIDNGIRNAPPDVAAHRFPFQWTGDVGPDFSYLQGALENCVYSGVQSLLPYMSTDLGGFVADPTVEGYIRWIEFGALSPIYRPHCTMSLSRMPWTFGPTAEAVARRFLNMRYRLLPLLYAAARDNYETGEPLVRRLDLDYPQYAQARGNDEYLLGKGILVAPVLRGTPLSVVPQTWLMAPTGQAGLQGDYFSNNALSGSPVLTRNDPTVNFNWGTGSPDPSVPVDNFSARWTGLIQVPAATGDVVLATLEDDGVRLWIDDQLVIDAWGGHNSSTTEAQTPLAAGTAHSLRLEYQELTGNAVIGLQWHPAINPVAQAVWIPPGTWLDAWTGQPVAGPASINNNCPLDRLPVYIRSGALVAQAPEMQFIGQQPWDPITLDVYPCASETNQITLYEDDGLTQAYAQGQFRKTVISASADGASNIVRVAIGGAVGGYASAPTQRAWVARLHRPAGWPAGFAPVQIAVNGQVGRTAVRLIRNETAMPLGAKNGAPDADCFEVSLPAGAVTSGNLLEASFAPTASPWTSRDVGSVAFEGGAACSNNVYLIRGGGADVSGTNDACHFMYLPLSGDAQVTARIVSQDATDPSAKSGLMLRETLDPGSRHASIFVTAGSGLSFQWRAVAGGASSYNGALPGAAPYWVRLVRSGSGVAGFISTNSLDWTLAGSIGLAGLNPLAYWGLAVTAHNDSTSSVAVIDNVSLHSSVSISSLPDQSLVLGLPLPAIPFTVGSATVPAESLVVTPDSTNATLLPVGNVALGGAGSNRWVTLTPVPGLTGVSRVTLTASDGVYSASAAFLLTVNPPPMLSSVSDATAGQIGLTWPLYAGVMTLWSTTNLSPPVVWSPASDAVLATNGSSIFATLPATNSTRFFRLSAQPP